MRPLVIQLENLETKAREVHTFKRSPVHIGRNELNDLTLHEPFVSLWHALIRFDEQSIRYLDLGSTNGTLLDGLRLEKNVPRHVDASADLRIGPLRLHLSRDARLAARADFEHKTQFRRRLEREEPPADATRVLRLPRPPRLAPRPPDERDVASSLPTVVVANPFLEEPSPSSEAASGPTPLGDAGLRLLTRFARTYLPQAEAPGSEREAEQFLDRLADVLETCATAFIELRRGHDQFGEQMALRTAGEDTPLRHARDARSLLAQVLDWRGEDRGRVEDLKRGFTDLMIHELALLNGMQEGARGLLERLGPERIERELGGTGWPFRNTARWRRFVQHHGDLSCDDQALSAALFGPEFAQAYAAVVGGDAEGGREE